MELKYCIKHERMVMAEPNIICEEGHIDFILLEHEVELDYCCFPLGYAFCPPPELEENWIEKVGEPYLDDLLENQEKAEQAFAELLFDLEVLEV